MKQLFRYYHVIYPEVLVLEYFIYLVIIFVF